MKCHECGAEYVEVTDEYRMETKEGTVIVPDLQRMRCKCGPDGELLDMDACRRIDEAYKILRNCKAFTPKRKEDGSYTNRCALCGWMERDH